MIIGTPEEVLIAQKHMNKVHGNDYFIAISKPIFLEIANKNVDRQMPMGMVVLKYRNL